jgi:hypothetical protein
LIGTMPVILYKATVAFPSPILWVTHFDVSLCSRQFTFSLFEHFHALILSSGTSRIY